jgi:ribonuclease VapC
MRQAGVDPSWCSPLCSGAGPAGTQLLDELLDRVGVRIVDVDAALPTEAMVSWRRFGKGRHRAGLNVGDTFSHALAVRG